MTKALAPAGQTDILLDAGTNEVELLMFEINGECYGVNVAKVREVIVWKHPTPSPMTRPEVEGVIHLRDSVVPIVSLRKYYDLPPIDGSTNHRIVILEFNDLVTGFTVDRVHRICRLSWSDVSPVPQACASEGAAFTGIARFDDQTALVIDFEKILADLGNMDFGAGDASTENSALRSQYHILLAEDSNTIRRATQQQLERMGYKVSGFIDGQQAWEHVRTPGDDGGPLYHMVVTDIEMPRMDGLSLVKKIKETEHLKDVPVVVFSSLITDENRKKGEQVGADEQIIKPNVAECGKIVDRWIAKRYKVAGLSDTSCGSGSGCESVSDVEETSSRTDLNSAASCSSE